MESTPPRAALFVDPASLAAAFADLPDHRRAGSIVYPLPAMLAMAVAAILANHGSVLAMAEWGARQEASLLAALGFPDGRTPCQSTLQRLFRRLDGDALAATLTQWVSPQAVVVTTDPAPQGVAIDGKAQRGRLRFAQDGGPVHALSAFCHDHGVVLAHEPIAANADKAEAELTVAPALLA
ncbi:MAG TPA: transposase family protein, partial [Thermomicrobiales bacterium]|nr:transposase family protein [Thermomicrobiales bacterium]